MNDKVFFRKALLPTGWRENVRAEIGSNGTFTSIEAGVGPDRARVFEGICVPGVSNLHSHAFQRAMAGLAETAGPVDNTFWTWRKVMYGFVRSISPEDLEAIASQLYVELLKSGYTRVGEFHYLHHQPDGTAYDTVSEMSDRIFGAARRTGIGLTHLPVLYAHGGLGGAAADDGQRRFVNRAERFLELVTKLEGTWRDAPGITLGIAPHSLRAVTDELLRDVLDGLPERVAKGPVHIHISEQTKEVEDCIAWSKQRPVEWLYDRFDIDNRWCLIHATHTNASELKQISSSSAVAGLCPTTEANLGDGLFAAPEFKDLGGIFGIGSDSNISTDPADELRTLEYGLRATRQKRNILHGAENFSTGRWLFDQAVAGGAQACGIVSGIATGARADFILLDGNAPALAGRGNDQVLDAWIFFNGPSPVKDVFVSGTHVIKQGRHVDEEDIKARFTATMTHLAQSAS